MHIRKALSFAALTFAFSVGVSATAHAEVQLTMQNGRVTLVAKNATLRQILAEWAKVGQTTILNADRAPGGPITMTLTDMPEAKALDIVLRSLAGYMAAPRAAAAANLSQFDRVVIMPTLATPPTLSAGGAPPPPQFPQPGVQPPFPGAPPPADDQDDAPAGPRSGPIFNTFPQVQIANPPQQGMPMPNPGAVSAPQGPLVLPQQQQQAPTATYPGMPTSAPTGTSAPGMIIAPPQVPGQPPGAIPPKRPGGH